MSLSRQNLPQFSLVGFSVTDRCKTQFEAFKQMGRCRFSNLLLLLLQQHVFFSLLVFTGCSSARTSPTPNTPRPYINTRHIFPQYKASISSIEKDVTTPVTTVRTPPSPILPSTPMINPDSNPDSISPSTNNASTPKVSPVVSAGASWCIAKQNAQQKALQLGLDYACGNGRSDCNPIQQGGSCYYPNTLWNHASFAFNGYYQKNPIPSSCNFGGTAVTTSTDPSTGSCRYPSTSTSSSVLNTTDSNGETVFGAVPSTPSLPSQAATIIGCPPHFMSLAIPLGIIMWFRKF